MIGPHCYRREFERTLLLTPFHVADEVSKLWQKGPGTSIKESAVEKELPGSETCADKAEAPIGLLVADKPGHEFKIIENPIPSHLVDLLVGRLMHKSFMQKDTGANSFFIK